MRSFFTLVITCWLVGPAFAQQNQPVPPQNDYPSPITVDAIPQAPQDAGPDPTARTIDQLRREIGALRELIESRLNAGDRAVSLLQDDRDNQPERTKAAVDQLRSFHDEKFSGVTIRFEGIQKQFDERDVRTEQLAVASKTAVDAALNAAEKAVGAALVNSSQVTAKSEAAVTKQIDAIGDLIRQGQAATDGKIDDLKQRLTAVESRAVGQTAQRAESGDNWGFVFGLAGMFAAIMSIAAGIAIAVRRPVVATK